MPGEDGKEGHFTKSMSSNLQKLCILKTLEDTGYVIRVEQDEVGNVGMGHIFDGLLCPSKELLP